MIEYIKERRYVMLANLLAMLGIGAATAGSQASFMWMFDEEECPESLIK